MNVLTLGGSFQDASTFVAPYVFSKFPSHLDGYESGVIIQTNVRIRQNPTVKSPIIGSLSFDILTVLDWTPIEGDEQNWIAVKTAMDQRGFVAERYIRSPIDYRAIFKKRDGKWVLTTLIAGD